MFSYEVKYIKRTHERRQRHNLHLIAKVRQVHSEEVKDVGLEVNKWKEKK